MASWRDHGVLFAGTGCPAAAVLRNGGPASRVPEVHRDRSEESPPPLPLRRLWLARDRHGYRLGVLCYLLWLLHGVGRRQRREQPRHAP